MTFLLHEHTSLGKVKLKVSNLDRSIQFYEQVIGLRVLSRENDIAELTANGQTSLIQLLEVGDSFVGSKRGTTGLYHYALLLPDRKELGKIVHHFLANHIQFGQADHLVSEALYLSDPDGNGIEIYRDRPRDEWEYDQNNMVKMSTDPLDLPSILAASEGEAFNGLSPATVMGHVHLHIGSLTEAQKYYCNLLGFSVESDWSMNGALFIGAGGYHHHIGLNIWNGRGGAPLPDHATGLDYFTIYLASDEDLQTIKQNLEDSGYSIEPFEDGYITRDPFQIGIKLIVK